MRDEWWIDRVGYQVYPRSFQDSNGDGIGDIPGIISRLDHLERLGIGFIWLSPVFDSPMADNGYDIADYYDVAPEFGTLADMDRLIAEAKRRDIGIVMDLVVNHTSDQHPWFRASRSARDDPHRDWYIWRDPALDGGPPSAQPSYFGGPAWRWDEATGQYYLALFTPEQPDLDWSNPQVREEVWKLMRFWLDRGIAGFRMDVIDHIGKDIDANVLTDGPRLHDYLKEMHRRVLKGRNALTVGEAWSVTPETALLYTGRDRDELDMVFQFAHIVEHWDAVHGKWKPAPFDLRRFKRVMNDWQSALSQDGWNALFLSNHDLPRAVSAFGDDGGYRVRSAKALGLALHLMKGTPFIYQGEEIGMTNARFTDIGQFRDIETLNLHRELTARGMPEAEFLAGANANSRDNARTPMQWNGAPQSGFTSGTPWIDVNENHRAINVAADTADPDGVFAHYRKLCSLRRDHPVIVHGSYTPLLEDHARVMAYTRVLDGRRLVVLANLSGEPLQVDLPLEAQVSGECLVWTVTPRPALGAGVSLEPWEAVGVLEA